MNAVRINTLRRYEHVGARAGGKMFNLCRMASRGQYYSFSATTRRAVCFARSGCGAKNGHSTYWYSMSQSQSLLTRQTYSNGRKKRK